VKCITCLLEKEGDDFLLGNTECYKCVYNEKIKKLVKSPVKVVIPGCKICDGRIKPPRTVYCCEECAEIGWLKQRAAYWPRGLKSWE